MNHDPLLHPIPDSYWAVPGQILAGEYPGAVADEDARQKLRALLSAGVTTFFDLTQAGEYGLKPYLLLAVEEAAARKRTIQHRRFPIRDMHVPSPEVLRHILDSIDEAVAAGELLYVHCFGGIGRTGTVIGAYYVRHGMTGEDAIAKISRLRFGIPDGARQSPETDAQQRLVLTWPEGGNLER